MYVISPIAKGNWRGLYTRHSESADLDHSGKKDPLFEHQWQGCLWGGAENSDWKEEPCQFYETR